MPWAAPSKAQPLYDANLLRWPEAAASARVEISPGQYAGKCRKEKHDCGDNNYGFGRHEFLLRWLGEGYGPASVRL
jgi:hypothetical protein